MRLTIFWRVIVAQSVLIILLVTISLYALSQLHWLTRHSAELLTTDVVCLELGKRLRTVFIAQMRSAEKYVLLQDQAFLDRVLQRHQDFVETLDHMTPLLVTPYEREVVAHTRALYTQYMTGLTAASLPLGTSSQTRGELGERIIAGITDYIRTHEDTIVQKMTQARDHAAWAALVVGWLVVGGISGALVMAYRHARGLSRPLQQLANALRDVGCGKFGHTLQVKAPHEIRALAQTFNGMATALAALDQMKTDFIAHMSHELRTPLAGIREGTSLLLEQIPGSITTSQRQILDVVWEHSERLWHHISSLLDVAKMDAGMMEYMRVPSDLRMLIAQGRDAVMLLAHKKQLTIAVECPDTLPLLLLDKSRMQQVVDNLLSNAVKFTPVGGTIRITATVQITEQERWVELRVADSGLGIPAEEGRRIFERFYQSPAHRQGGQLGTGLGLAIARRIVEAHAGRIWVESQPGAGATFLVWLPLAAEPNQETS